MRPTRFAQRRSPALRDLTEQIHKACWHCRRLGLILCGMSDVTRILSQIEHGDSNAAENLLPLVYDELRKLAAVKMAQEKPGQTLQATALVHEAYLRLVGDGGPAWNS